MTDAATLVATLEGMASDEEREKYTRYFPPDPSAVVEAAAAPAEGTITVDTGGPDGVLTYRRAARLSTPYGPLTLWWLEGYGGGLFLPFRDGTCGARSYGGGRYLTDTAKGTFGRGLTIADGTVRLDFNYAYNPSCAYDEAWACPLAPPENRLDIPIRAGERLGADAQIGGHEAST